MSRSMYDAEGLARLGRAVMNGNPHDVVPWDEDAPVWEDLHTGALTQHGHRSGNLSPAKVARIRYLAACFPNTPKSELPRIIAAVLGVQGNLSWEADIRLMLDGRNPNDPSKRLAKAAPIERYQVAGMCLMRGDRYRHAARTAGLGEDTVQVIDHYLGLKERRRKRLMDKAVDAARDGVSIREFAQREQIPFAQSQRFMCAARIVLRELGELPDGVHRIQMVEKVSA